MFWKKNKTLFLLLLFFSFNLYSKPYKAFLGVDIHFSFPGEGLTASDKISSLNESYLSQQGSGVDVSKISSLYGASISARGILTYDIYFLSVDLGIFRTYGGSGGISKYSGDLKIEEEYSLSRMMFFLPVFLGVDFFISGRTYFYMGFSPFTLFYLIEKESFTYKEGSEVNSVKSYSNSFSSFSYMYGFKIGIRRFFSWSSFWSFEIVRFLGDTFLNSSSYKYSLSDPEPKSYYRYISLSGYWIGFGLGIKIF